MSNADEMFEELGYENGTGNNLGNGEKFIWYKRFPNYNKVLFYEKTKQINITANITMQELKAINQFCKEKRWLDE